MKTIYSTLIILFVLIGFNTKAQTYTMNWGSAFSPAWSAGSASSRTTTNIGSSGVTATVSFTQSEANAISNFGGFSSPQVSASGSPFNTALGTNQSNLALGMNLSTNAGYVDVTISFSASVSNISFNISDIDKNAANSNSYFDEVEITGFNGITAVTNPTLSKLNGSSVNNTTDTVIISGNIARSNTTNNRGGNTPSDINDQNGTVRVVFGSQAMTRIVIRYRNAAGAQANPGQQAIGIGNISFRNFAALPVQLLSFNANYKNGVAFINWSTSQEISTKSFVIERGENGQQWTVVGELPAAGVSTTVKNYQLKDLKPAAVNLYRIRQIDLDGKINYSKIITLSIAGTTKEQLSIVPNPVQSAATLVYNSNEQHSIVVAIYNSNGVLINSMNIPVQAGSNSISLHTVNQLAKGTYTAVVYNSNKSKTGAVQFIKL